MFSNKAAMIRKLLIGVILLCVASVAMSQVIILRIASDNAGSGPVFNAQATAFFARLATQPNAARKTRYNTFFAALNTAGVYSVCDAMYLFAGRDSATSLTNLIQNQYNATLTATPPIFNQDGGFVSQGTGSSIDSNFNPSTAISANYVQNSASLLAWSVTPDAIAGETVGYGTGGIGNSEIYPRYTTNQMFTALNATIEGTVASITDGSGLRAVDRSSAANFVTYTNGVAGATTTAASQALVSSDITFLTQGLHVYSLGGVAFGAICGHLTSAQHLAIYNAVVAFRSGLASDYPTTRMLQGTRNDLPNSNTTVAFATANTFNVRKETFLRSSCLNPSVVYEGFAYPGGTEIPFANAITYHTQIEDHLGTFTPMLKGGVANQVVNPGDVFNTTDIAAVTIPAGQVWIRTFGTIASGVFYETDYAPNSAVGDFAQQGTNLTDLSGGGVITTNMAFMPMGHLICEVPTGTRSVAIMGDSIAQGVGGYVQPVAGDNSGGGIGYNAGYLDTTTTLASYVHLGRTGLSAATTATFTTMLLRLAWLAAANVPDLWEELGSNDVVASGHTATQSALDIGSTNNNLVRGNLSFVRVWQSTITVATTVTGPPTSDSNQVTRTMGAGGIDGLNTTIAAGTIQNQTNFVDANFPTRNTTVPNIDWWQDNYSNDGVHPLQLGGAAIVAYGTAHSWLSP
jgi:hypothetical protein